MITAIKWIGRGDKAKEVPNTSQEEDDSKMGPVEMRRLQEQVLASGFDGADPVDSDSDKEEEEEDADDSMDTGDVKKTKDVNDLSEYNLDDYDNEPDGAGDGIPFLGGGLEGVMLHDGEDPYITMDNDDDADQEDADDVRIRKEDLLFLVAVAEEDVSHLDLYVCEEDTDEEEKTNNHDEALKKAHNVYVHHDILIPAAPLCVEWLGYRPGTKLGDKNQKGNFAAVGTFRTEIEIWDLDTLEVVRPALTLGGEALPTADPRSGTKPKGKGKKKRRELVMDAAQLLEGSHTDAVLSISWNKHHPNVLASASADKSVKLWDLQDGKCLQTYSVHKDKVQCVKWNDTFPNILLTGSYDRTVTVLDVKSTKPVARWTLSSDIECLEWSPHQPTLFLASTDGGIVTAHDSSKHDGSTLFTISAHEPKAVSGLTFNTKIPTLIATSGLDQTIKLWDLSDNKPSLVHTIKTGEEKVFTLEFSADSPTLLLYGGTGDAKVVDMRDIPAVVRKFGAQL
eukprot:TRINITY_DN148_c0_g4_i1.p1 TRINITY_DN148_c0_g4~~TRINITY_DN148_c0_g4_i1.p1  ORF type:complete len:535 (+),score=152.52 TRINITY_DN148_c0_g4_i1:79-1605(+)